MMVGDTGLAYLWRRLLSRGQVMRHVFPCSRRLDSHENNCRTETMLRMIGGSWTVTVKTSEGKRTATTGKVQITMYGTSGHTATLHLSSPDPGTLAFTSGAESEFHISTGQVCTSNQDSTRM
ncbi:uncharacterized protein LOC128215389 [Mya arenaria]|uniref:uncharacterized protein LOC128215389 n=1 Tax=Mya arenaria TaxID=6604 RepID=UPI0022E935F3|nr:uncharacterized protein LOC128215389 [Mya arenaria]